MGNKETTIGHLFGAALTVKGKWSLPFIPAATLLIITWVAGRNHQQISWMKRMKIGAFTMPVIIGSEWCHNLAHTALAWWIGKPPDAINIIGGMPLLYYKNVNDPDVSPRQHILRALGGPLLNALLLLPSIWFQNHSRPGTIAREVTNAAVHMNLFLSTVSLLPIPGIDGGPILKWSLVAGGASSVKADQVLRRVNGFLGIILGIGAFFAFKKRRCFLGSLMFQFGALAIAISSGLIKEK